MAKSPYELSPLWQNITELGDQKKGGGKNTDWNLVQKTGDFHQKNSEIWWPLEKK
jgi:hypothetical protein